ncbi:MAG: DUF3786 domain-containing protein [bacterium]
MSSHRLNALDILKHLNRSNCRECGAPTCMAFAALVVQGQQDPRTCPHLAPGVLDDLASRVEQHRNNVDEQRREALEQLKTELDGVDFQAASERLGVPLRDGRLLFHCLGRVFEIDAQGNLHSQCHNNPWLHVPLLDHLMHGEGAQPQGSWVPFSELRGAADWSRFFNHRCAQPLESIARDHVELFFDILDIFGGEPQPPDVAQQGAVADRAVVIHPIRKAPILFCYWDAAEGFEARLTLLFDRTVEKNLSAGSLFQLAGGLVEMLRRMVVTHGDA